MEENLHFKIHWPSLIGQFSKYKPQGAYIWRGDLTEGFLRYQFRAHTWMGLFLECYGILFFHCSHSALISHSFAAHPSFVTSFLEHIFCGVLKEKQTTCYLKNLYGMQCPVQWSISLSHSCMAGVSLLIPSLPVNCTLSSLAKSPNQCRKLSLKSPEGSG